MGECKECSYLTENMSDLKRVFEMLERRVTEIEIENGQKNEKLNNLEKLLLEIKEDTKEIKSNNIKFLKGIISGVTIAVAAAFLLQALKIFHW